MHNKGKHLCASCRHYFPEEEMVYGPDPFAEEIGGDDTPMWLCDDCVYASAMEI
jgi:hypothetical protein